MSRINHVLVYFGVIIMLFSIGSVCCADSTLENNNPLMVEGQNQSVNTAMEDASKPDNTLLKNTIRKAMGYNAESYTEDSYLQLIESIRQAQEIVYRDGATQAEMDRAQEQLQNSMNQLVLANNQERIVLIGIGAVSTCCIVIILALFSITKKSSAKDKPQRRKDSISEKKQEPEKKQADINKQNNNKKRDEAHSGKLQKQQQETEELLSIEQRQQIDAQIAYLLNDKPVAGHTMAMQESDRKLVDRLDATDNLKNMFAKQRKAIAFLLCQATGERVHIGTVEFIIGTDVTKVNYCVKDNANVSEFYMKIVERAGKYYLIDLKSTNGISLNNQRLMPSMEAELKDSDVITAANIDFIFKIRK